MRKTGLFPNSIQRSLKTLENQKIVISTNKGNKRFYYLNNNHPYLSEIKAISTDTSNNQNKNNYKYIKWVNRECSVALNAAIGSAQCNPKYIKRFRIEPVDFLWYNSVTGGVYNSFEQVVKTGKKISKEVKKDASYAKRLANSCITDGENLILETQKSIKKDLPHLSETELYTS